jgi:hypothetical protein
MKGFRSWSKVGLVVGYVVNDLHTWQTLVRA